MSIKSKFLIGVLVVAVVFVGFAFVNNKAAAETCSITTTLRVGSTGAEVMCLQSAVGATADGKFGPMTQAAVMAWQSAHGLVADGVFGPLSRAAWMVGGSTTGFPVGCTSTEGYSSVTGEKCSSTTSLPAGCTSTVGYSPTTGEKCDGGSSVSGPLTGGAGTVDEYKLLASPSDNREVGEDSEDVKVLGMSVEADGSDIEVTAMKLEFTWNTADEDFSDYATEVAIWMGSDELGRVDADDFSEDSATDTPSKNITLADGGIVRDGDVENFYVTVSGVSNIDSLDLTETWDLDVTSVRYVDAQGALISEDPDLAARTFSFESLATAEDLELKLTENTGNPKAQVVEVDASDSTDNVSLLKTNLKAIGGDIDLKEMTVNVVSGTWDVDEIASAYMLVVDGEEFSLDAADCDTVACDNDEDYTFTDIDMTIDEGDTVVVEVLANVNGTDDYAEGDTLVVTLDNDLTVAEDVSGQDLEGTDLTGIIIGEEQAFFSQGIRVSFVSASEEATPASDPAAANDLVEFTLKYKVEAFGADAYVDGTITEDGDGTYAAGSGVNFYVTDGAGVASTNTSTPVLTVDSNATAAANTTWKIAEGDTATFTLTVVTTADLVTEFAKMSLSAITWDLTAIAATTEVYTFNLDDYKTDPVYIVNNI